MLRFFKAETIPVTGEAPIEYYSLLLWIKFFGTYHKEKVVDIFSDEEIEPFLNPKIQKLHWAKNFPGNNNATNFLIEIYSDEFRKSSFNNTLTESYWMKITNLKSEGFKERHRYFPLTFLPNVTTNQRSTLLKVNFASSKLGFSWIVVKKSEESSGKPRET